MICRTRNVNMDVSDALSAFANGSVEAGEFVLTVSGDTERHMEIAGPGGFDAIRSALAFHRHDEKLHEIAAGIIANLMLYDDINDMCVERMDIPDFLYE